MARALPRVLLGAAVLVLAGPAFVQGNHGVEDTVSVPEPLHAMSSEQDVPFTGPTATVQDGDHDLTHDHNSLYSVHMWAEYVVLPMSATLLVAIVICNLLHVHEISWIPESLVMGCLGALLIALEMVVMGGGGF
jgi:hypothetical protein